MGLHHARAFHLYLLTTGLMLTLYYYNSVDDNPPIHKMPRNKTGYHTPPLADEKYHVIKLADQHRISYTLEGHSFDTPQHSTRIAGNVSTAFLHSFSAQVEKEVNIDIA